MPKQIFSSVGNSGANAKFDVMTVQYLLNCVPRSEGGPDLELTVDGLAGPLTIGAISQFQKAHLNWSDGRVDPFGPTLAAMQHYDPYPDLTLSFNFKAAKYGGKGLGGGYGGKLGETYGGKFGGKYGGESAGKWSGGKVGGKL